MGIQLAVVEAEAEGRVRNAVLLGALVVWMAYTRVFWSLYPYHATLPVCPFRLITGHPCPFCGGTRSFAYTWQGNLPKALALYPLGPLLFVGTLVAIPVLAFAVLANRDLRLRLPRPVWRALIAGALTVLAVSWTLKLTVLPN